MLNKLNINPDLYKTITEDLKNYIIENYQEGEYIKYDEVTELSYNIYNQYYYIIGTAQAAEWLYKYRNEAIEANEGWEQDLGEGQGLKFGEDEKNVNLVLIWFCNQIIYSLDYQEGFTREELLEVIK